MKRLIECVPNFSEGRDPAKVDALIQAMSKVPGVWVLDHEMDADHNRCVITLAGEPDAVAEAALQGTGKAVELIDMTQHAGAHPRVGATDVVPFIPVEGVSLEDCVALARRVGQEIWKRYRIPVFFYEAAATRPDRVNLENIRRGQFEGLREELKKNHDRQPDVGEPKLHPTAGVTVVGARKFLVAYNVNLNTSDVGIANKIAKAIRFSSGGLRYVKSMGVDLKARNIAQVSVNLTDYEQTPMHRVYEMVKREAARYGAAPVGSEIVGLVPKKAIEMAADYFLQLENFSPSQVFENKLADALAGAPLDEKKGGKLAALARPFVEAVAEPTATPGGGSVSAFAAALAAGLGQMVAGLSRKKKSQAAHVDKLSEHLDALRREGEALSGAIDADAARRLNRDRAARRSHTKIHQRRRGSPFASGRTGSCTPRTSKTTGHYRRGIHEVRLKGGQIGGRSGCTRSDRQRGDQSRRHQRSGVRGGETTGYRRPDRKIRCRAYVLTAQHRRRSARSTT
jgi:glutamate formiminotransferase / formiminotetrahydrofolate cyclodeaminase